MKHILLSISIVSASFFLTGCLDRTTISSDVTGADSVGITALSPGGQGFVSLSWTANAGEQDGFYVEGSADNSTFVRVAVVSDGTTATTVTSLANGATYFFRIRGYNASGTSAPTAVVTASVPAAAGS